MRLRLSVVWLVLLASSARASEILQVVQQGAAALISNRKVGIWKEGDRVCAVRNTKEIACGVISRLLPQGAMVQFQGDRDLVIKGDAMLAVGDKRPTAAAPALSPSMHYAVFPVALFTAGVAINFDYPSPELNAIVGVTKYSALGINFSMARDADLLQPVYSGKKILATMNFFNRRGLKGLWAQVGIGMDYFTLAEAGVESSGKAVTGLAAFGWRNLFSRHFSLGVIAGLQYTDRRRAGTFHATEDRFTPYLHVDLGFHL